MMQTQLAFQAFLEEGQAFYLTLVLRLQQKVGGGGLARVHGLVHGRDAQGRRPALPARSPPTSPHPPAPPLASTATPALRRLRPSSCARGKGKRVWGGIMHACVRGQVGWARWRPQRVGARGVPHWLHTRM